MSIFYALLRRFATITATGLFAVFTGNWQKWLEAAAKGDDVTALWLPSIWLAIEVGQKIWRTVRDLRKAGKL